MFKLSVGVMTLVATCLALTDVAYSQAEALQGTQDRSINQLNQSPTRPINIQPQGNEDPTLYDGIPLRSELEDRIDLVRDRQGGQRQLGVYPTGSPNMGDEIQIEYRLQEPQR